ncbi:hypothetical protein A3726_02930 [Erythrobacter sp. HI0037]|nr:hypothetical protein A3727_03105 [Erythrobacter sp. HI0038]KZY28904.1 hypothetical protein A3726_02930 [Erythrobacter sp. HI0037]
MAEDIASGVVWRIEHRPQSPDLGAHLRCVGRDNFLHRIDAKHRIGSPGCLHFEKARKVVCGSEQRRCREGSIPAEGFRTAIATEILCDAKFQCLFVIEGGPSHAERMKHAVAHEILKALA